MKFILWASCMLSVLVKSIGIAQKGMSDGVIKPILSSIFMMRMAYSVLKGLHDGSFSVSSLKERRWKWLTSKEKILSIVITIETIVIALCQTIL